MTDLFSKSNSKSHPLSFWTVHKDHAVLSFKTMLFDSMRESLQMTSFEAGPQSSPLSPATGITPLDNIIPTLRLLAPQGFVFVHSIGMKGPEFVHSEFPKAWQVAYEKQNFMWRDPILLWSVTGRGGDKRWSDIDHIDLMGVMDAAKGFGLNFGAIFTRGTIKKSVLSLARTDREFTDEEMTLLSSMMTQLMTDVSLDRGLSHQELETLRLLRDGLAHKEIATTLAISVSAVKFRLNNARQKLGAQSNVHALALALQRNLI